MTPRFTHNSRPMDGPNLPADWATTSKRGTLRLTLALALLFIVLVTVGSEAGRAILQGLPA